MGEDFDMPERTVKRDWTPVWIALASHAICLAWYFGSMNVRMNNVEHVVAVAESRGGFATRDDLKEQTALQSIQDQQRDMRANAIDGKVDRVMAQPYGNRR